MYLAALAREWMDNHANVDMDESATDRNRRRQIKMDGMEKWHFDLILRSLPLIFQVTNILLAYALSNYLFPTNKAVASAWVSVTVLGLFFYFFTTFAVTFFDGCPFKTLLSLALRSLARFSIKHLWQSKEWLRCIFSLKKPWKSDSGCADKESPDDRFELTAADWPPLPSNTDTNRDGYKTDSISITWTFDRVDADKTMVILGFIPEVVWHKDIQTVPLKRTYVSSL